MKKVNLNKKIPLSLYVLSGLLYACSPSVTPSGSTGKGYYEDLKSYRPDLQIPVVDTSGTVSTSTARASTPTGEFAAPINDEINTKLDDLASVNEDVRYITGFTVQVYTGRSRESANIAKGKIYSLLPNSVPSLKYNVPNYKVNVGKFFSRLEAQKTYATLKKKFPNAMVVMKKIKIHGR